MDESNVVSSVRPLGRKLDWLKLRDHLASADRARELIEMVIYAGLPPPIPEWQTERDKKNKFLHWLRSNGFLVVAKDGSPEATLTLHHGEPRGREESLDNRYVIASS
jgi:hypothetical protein